MSGPLRADTRGGFALALVVLMLFAIAVAGITGYQMVSNELVLATQNRDSQKALSVARAGLQRFLGETVGQVGDSVSYAIGEGIATVTTRRVLRKDTRNHLYFIKSVGTVADARTPTSPATRTVGTYAWHRIAPVPQKGALWVSGGTTTVRAGGIVDGTDLDLSGVCPGAGGVAGVITGGTAEEGGGGTITGGVVEYDNGYSAVYDTVGIRWDILTNPSFPVDFDGYYPDFGSLPADSFPIVRFAGSHAAALAVEGRGVLIVGGTLTFSGTFLWKGIVLAGALGGISPPASATVSGMLIGGLNASNPSVELRSALYQYHSCNAYNADVSLSYLQVVGDAMFEVNG